MTLSEIRKFNGSFIGPMLIIGILAVTTMVSTFYYQKYRVSPERELITKRYAEFRAIVATGVEEDILEWIAPERRAWAKQRMYLYSNFAPHLNQNSTISVSSDKAMICPRPQRHFWIIPGGHGIGMLKIDGDWYFDRVYID